MRDPTLSPMAGSSFQISVLSKPLLPHSLDCATVMFLESQMGGVSNVGNVHNANGRR